MDAGLVVLWVSWIPIMLVYVVLCLLQILFHEANLVQTKYRAHGVIHRALLPWLAIEIVIGVDPWQTHLFSTLVRRNLAALNNGILISLLLFLLANLLRSRYLTLNLKAPPLLARLWLLGTPTLICGVAGVSLSELLRNSQYQMLFDCSIIALALAVWATTIRVGRDLVRYMRASPKGAASFAKAIVKTHRIMILASVFSVLIIAYEVANYDKWVTNRYEPVSASTFGLAAIALFVIHMV